MEILPDHLRFKSLIVTQLTRQKGISIGLSKRGKIRRVLNKTQTIPYKQHISFEI